jgi:putative addiction module killer protein
MHIEPYRIKYYTDEHGNKPFREWLQDLRDQIAAVRIRARLTRVKAGNFGTVRNVGEGVVELKIDHGPGYRVYYAIDAGTIHSSFVRRRQANSTARHRNSPEVLENP